MKAMLVVIALLWSAASAAATVQLPISLRDPSGSALRGTHDLTWSIWTAPTAGIRAHTVEQPEFNVSVASVYNIDFGDTEVDGWLQLDIDGIPYHQGRTRIRSGSLDATALLYGDGCADEAPTRPTVAGRWTRFGAWVEVSLVHLPNATSHPDHCLRSISGLPYSPSVATSSRWGNHSASHHDMPSWTRAEASIAPGTRVLTLTPPPPGFDGIFWPAPMHPGSPGPHTHTVTYMTEDPY